MSAQEKITIRRLRTLAKEWPDEWILIHLVDSHGLILFDKHPEEGGKPIETFGIRADSVTTFDNQ